MIFIFIRKKDEYINVKGNMRWMRSPPHNYKKPDPNND